MKLSDLTATGHFRDMAENCDGEREVTGCYVCDLLSWVLGHAKAGEVWVTMMGHLNIVAVAALLGVSAVVVADSAGIEPDTVARARQEGVTLLSSPLSSFQVAGLVSRLLE